MTTTLWSHPTLVVHLAAQKAAAVNSRRQIYCSTAAALGLTATTALPVEAVLAGPTMAAIPVAAAATVVATIKIATMTSILTTLAFRSLCQVKLGRAPASRTPAKTR